jgi:hypothetical protein
MLRVLGSLGALSLACILLCVVLHNSDSPVLAQEPGTPEVMAPAAPDTSAPAPAGEPERIEIRIEFPIVEPLFDIFYAREEPRIETDVIAPVTNPLQQLPPPSRQEEKAEGFRAKRIEKARTLLDRPRE